MELIQKIYETLETKVIEAGHDRLGFFAEELIEFHQLLLDHALETFTHRHLFSVNRNFHSQHLCRMPRGSPFAKFQSGPAHGGNGSSFPLCLYYITYFGKNKQFL